MIIDFEPCDGDSTTTVSTEHNADLALVHDIAKWLSCFSKECRNINRLANQLVKCQNLQTSGHKTVEVRGVGQVNLEAQIDEVRQQIRKCDLSKSKAYARLMAIKESGLQVENLDELEARIKTEMKTVSLDVDSSNQPLSRTPSMKSANVSDKGDDGRASGMDKSCSEDDNHTPEPEQYVRDNYEDDSEDRETPAPSYNAASNQGGWAEGTWDDPSQGWGSAPVQVARVPEPAKTTVPEVTYNPPESQEFEERQEPQQEWNQEQANQEMEEEYQTPLTDGTQMDGKICRALYAYQAQNSDELDLTEEEVVTIIAATDVDWVTAQNSEGQTGFVPAAYLEIVGDAPPPAEFDEVSTNETAYEAEPVPEPETQVVS